MNRIKVIGFEEHYKTREIETANKDHPAQKVYDQWKKVGRFTGPPGAGVPAGIYDIGDERIAAMDKAGIDVQILSHTVPGPEELDPAISIKLAADANDQVYQATVKHPERLKGFATLPMMCPKAAADELERCVRKLGFVGALINGAVKGRYMDDKFFWPVFARAEKLSVPIYLHPSRPTEVVISEMYDGFAPIVSGFLAQAGAGWHYDTGLHALRLILSGLFDQHPKLQIIVGHQFEMLGWMAWRAAASFPKTDTGLQLTVVEYLRRNFYGGILAGDYADQKPGEFDPDWELSFAAYQAMVNIIGVDRVLFTTDYPYGGLEAARAYFDRLPISKESKEKIGFQNAQKLLNLV